ncbi:phosphoribosyl-ATP diphosphatase [Pelagibacteraceae bacterium]|jgi:phosphoribosyl-ATP pyrophosphohydrolase|nr:phosphoribosyl-ATP diphosphatase [Pelagibacteraceae bacterium]|tara:strand:- start:1371 stop:1643 length:273 start_codon:yes stop_codon:yes gene_type:complete
MFKNLEELVKIIRSKKKDLSKKSYTNQLLNDKKLSVAKVKEEINELIEAIEENTNTVHESADVFYHLLVYLEINNIKVEDVMLELKKRQK